MAKSMKWKIFIITHGPVIEDYYKNDPLFSNDHFVFFNVSDTPIKHEKFVVINKTEVEGFIHLGKWWAESEVIYNIYKLDLYPNLDYIGFLHWDYELKSENEYFSYNVSKTIENLTRKRERFISFSTFSFAQDFSQKILMDKSSPNQLVGEGKNCYLQIIEDYNGFFDENISVEYLMSKRINLCSAFLCDIGVFDELMPFFCWIVESEKLMLFDTEHKYRFQGGMMERYIGCFSSKYHMAELPLFHRYRVSNPLESFTLLKRMVRKIKSLF
jgi:hypothetical protein